MTNHHLSLNGALLFVTAILGVSYLCCVGVTTTAKRSQKKFVGENFLLNPLTLVYTFFVNENCICRKEDT